MVDAAQLSVVHEPADRTRNMVWCCLLFVLPLQDGGLGGHASLLPTPTHGAACTAISTTSSSISSRRRLAAACHSKQKVSCC